MVVRIHPREPTLMTRVTTLFTAVAILVLAASCKKGGDAPSAATANDAAEEGLDCDHDLTSNALAKHAWPYPADYRDLRKKGGYEKFKLNLKPTHPAFVTAGHFFLQHIDLRCKKGHNEKPQDGPQRHGPNHIGENNRAKFPIQSVQPQFGGCRTGGNQLKGH